MTEKFEPRDYQEIIIKHIIDKPRCGVWAGMGLGKTSSTLLALSWLSLVEDVFPCLVLAPLRVAINTWPNEIAKWQEFKDLSIQPIVGSLKQREEKAGKLTDIHSINYDNLIWLREFWGEDWPYKTVVADESTKLKGFRVKRGKKRARALAEVAHSKVERFIELTGTCAPNGLQDLWGQLWFLDGGRRLGRSFSDFEKRWFRRDFSGWGLDPLPHAETEIPEKVKDLCISLEARDYFNISEPIETKIKVDLPTKARELYKNMEDWFYIELGDKPIEATNAAAKSQKCLQIASGAVYDNEDKREWEQVHDEKLLALEEIIEEAAGMPVLVAYHFNSDLDRLKKHFPKSRILDAKPETERDWNAGKIPVLLAHPASCGHGLNLQDGGNILVFFSVNWNLEDHLQIIERIGPTRQMQSGHNRAVFIYYILAKNTMDELVMQRLETKKSVQDILTEAVNHRS